MAAREDERRRIRRDLHDGLGPALAGITAALEGLEEVGRTDPGAAAAALPELRAQARAAVGDVRRLVDGLRPPALDELGLAGALREELRRLERSTGVRCTLDAPDRLPPLPAAVEVAALRIALEATTNAVRHAARDVLRRRAGGRRRAADRAGGRRRHAACPPTRAGRRAVVHAGAGRGGRRHADRLAGATAAGPRVRAVLPLRRRWRP